MFLYCLYILYVCLQTDFPAGLFGLLLSFARLQSIPCLAYQGGICCIVLGWVKAKTMRSCLVVTYNPANPPFHTWIKSLIGTLHEDPELKVLCNKIPIVTRQPPSVASLALKSRHWLGSTGPGPTQPPAGCHRLHAQRSCVCCARMEEVTDKVKSSKTDRGYNIRRHYNCQSSWVIYVVTCEE